MRLAGRTGRTVAAMLAVALITTTAAQADPGGLDPSFGTGGVVRHAAIVPDVNDTALQADGKLVVVGAEGPNTIPSYDRRWTVRRFNGDGTLDAGFGSGGVVTLFPSPSGAFAVQLDASGRIVVCGRSSVATKTVSTIVRLLSNGTLDPSFGSGGVTTFQVPNALGSYVTSLEIQGDGKPVVGGRAWFKLGKNDEQYALFVARCKASGSLDPTFGSGGIALYDPTPKGDDVDMPNSLGIQSTGKIVLGARFNTASASSSAWVVLRFRANGTRDTAFGPVSEAGKGIARLAVDGSDRIVAVGTGPNGAHASDVFVVRYLVDGARDLSFGAGGSTFVGQGNTSQAGSSVFQADGKIIVTLRTWDPQPIFVQPVRLLASGTLDSTFGTGGYGQPLAFAPAATFGTSTEVMQDGRILLAGWYALPGVRDVMIARYLGP